jgi:hypothetical protein
MIGYENIHACPKDVSCFERNIATMSLFPNVGVQQGCGKLGVVCESLGFKGCLGYL